MVTDYTSVPRLSSTLTKPTLIKTDGITNFVKNVLSNGTTNWNKARALTAHKVRAKQRV